MIVLYGQACRHRFLIFFAINTTWLKTKAERSYTEPDAPSILYTLYHVAHIIEWHIGLELLPRIVHVGDNVLSEWPFFSVFKDTFKNLSIVGTPQERGEGRIQKNVFLKAGKKKKRSSTNPLESSHSWETSARA